MAGARAGRPDPLRVVAGNGRLRIQGPVRLEPFDAQLAMAIRDAAIEPYQPYMPVPTRFSGRFNGDSKNRIAIKDGKTIIASKGTSWADKFEAKMPGAEDPLITIERMDLVDIDFDWPTKAIVGKAGFKRMSVEIERAEDGSFNIVKAFGGPAAPTVPDPKDAEASAAPKPALPLPRRQRPPRPRLPLPPRQRPPRPPLPSPRACSRPWSCVSERSVSRKARFASSTAARSPTSPRTSRRWT